MLSVIGRLAYIQGLMLEYPLSKVIQYLWVFVVKNLRIVILILKLSAQVARSIK